MSIIKRNSELRPFYSTLLDEFLNTGNWPAQMNQNMNIPALNVREDEESLMLDIRIPGMKKEDIKLDYNDGLLTISGESREEKEEEEKGKGKYLRKEFTSYSFKRTIELPEEKYNVAEAKASYRDGILEVSMPKNKEMKKLQKTIEVK
ncbi:Hsp20/alpha crystallin family protein [Odoribacter lunatus]|uniref:Hsp20/alpha crystallin family protein n=1 Tax=Odoribacter lunatus TaxID=2941335 RepID=UPI00203D93F9|nr:Hsp20/alpha crystallin family protein [Odoribacter lunatus]